LGHESCARDSGRGWVAQASSLPAQSQLTRYRHRMETVYDLLRIGASALVIVAVLFLVFGLIGYWSAARRA
jgi:hypothetical protein